MTAFLAAGALVVLAAAFVLLRRKPAASAGWSVGPTIDGKDYSAPVEIDAAGSFDFPTVVPGIHYVTKRCGPLAGTSQIRLRYRIEADQGVTFHDAQDGHEVTSGPVLYFQRAGDDWSGVGEYETYRWWAELSIGSLAPGEHEIIASFSDRWNAIETSNSVDQAAAFRAALESAVRIGFTFPNDTGAGHGIIASGNAHFTLLELTVA